MGKHLEGDSSQCIPIVHIIWSRSRARWEGQLGSGRPFSVRNLAVLTLPPLLLQLLSSHFPYSLPNAAAIASKVEIQMGECLGMIIQSVSVLRSFFFSCYRHVMNLQHMWWTFSENRVERAPFPRKRLKGWWASSIGNLAPFRCSSSKARVKQLWF